MVYGEDGNLHVDREIIPASLWNRLVLDRSQTLTTISGNVKKFEVEYVGEAELDVRGQKCYDPAFSADRRVRARTLVRQGRRACRRSLRSERWLNRRLRSQVILRPNLDPVRAEATASPSAAQYQ